MQILETKELAIPGLRALTFRRFADDRGYFSESYRQSQVSDALGINSFDIAQINESFSHAGVVRGLHFQWSPFMGKLVRTVSGRMIDLVVDIRPDSPTLGQGLMHEIAASPGDDTAEAIWVPAGFAHGNFFTEPTTIEYLCTGSYAPSSESGIAPTSSDIDWRYGVQHLSEFRHLLDSGRLSEKDRAAPSLEGWLESGDAHVFSGLGRNG
jgi:dTDP-4-dehydrorhamnose 3,5-epimerase